MDYNFRDWVEGLNDALYETNSFAEMLRRGKAFKRTKRGFRILTAEQTPLGCTQ